MTLLHGKGSLIRKLVSERFRTVAYSAPERKTPTPFWCASGECVVGRGTHLLGAMLSTEPGPRHGAMVQGRLLLHFKDSGKRCVWRGTVQTAEISSAFQKKKKYTTPGNGSLYWY